jgi:hypothetical protein
VRNISHSTVYRVYDIVDSCAVSVIGNFKFFAYFILRKYRICQIQASLALGSSQNAVIIGKVHREANRNTSKQIASQ